MQPAYKTKREVNQKVQTPYDVHDKTESIEHRTQ